MNELVFRRDLTKEKVFTWEQKEIAYRKAEETGLTLKKWRDYCNQGITTRSGWVEEKLSSNLF